MGTADDCLIRQNPTRSDDFLGADRDLRLSCCEGAQLRARFDTDAVKLACRPDSPPWSKLLTDGAARRNSLAKRLKPAMPILDERCDQTVSTLRKRRGVE